ncbi:porin family protein [Winogradskyella sp.]|uniref:porin family protein n=1 Tax=Winogradskyella sp. TaxID=1883156 RepID=UPI00261E9B48|nr:porin family protein [Winogradskyella sp.]
MKKLFLAAFAVFAFASVNAQDITFGAKAGVNFASLTGDDVDADGRTSFHLGAVANIGISEKFSVQPELLYSAQGLTNDGDVVGKLDYISLPILASFEVAEGFSVQAGPQVAFNINDSVEVDGEDAGDLDAEGVDFGLAAGLQYKMDSGLFFQARYGLGLSDVISDVDAKNSVIALSVGYFFL